jgi:hypothetical protein
MTWCVRTRPIEDPEEWKKAPNSSAQILTTESSEANGKDVKSGSQFMGRK